MINKKIKKFKKIDLSFSEESDDEISEETKIVPNIKPGYKKKEVCNFKVDIINFKFIFWDGFKIIKNFNININSSIEYLLKLAKQELVIEYSFLKKIEAENCLMLVINKNIIPNDYILKNILKLLNFKLNKDNNFYEILDHKTIYIIEKRHYIQSKHLSPFKNWKFYII